MGEACKDALRVGFDRAIKLEFHGAKVSTDEQCSVTQYMALTVSVGTDQGSLASELGLSRVPSANLLTGLGSEQIVRSRAISPVIGLPLAFRRAKTFLYGYFACLFLILTRMEGINSAG